MISMKRWNWALVGLAILVMGSPLPAEVIYTNFGTGDSYSPLFSPTIEDALWIGGEFTVPGGTNYYLTSVDMAVFGSNGGTLNVALYNSNASHLPTGPSLATATVNVTTTSAVQSATFAGTTELTAGNAYQVVLSPGTESAGFWNFNNQGVWGTRSL
jgi:hypothetical protein